MRKLWNRPDYPVWSLSTLSSEGQPNFNICTYVSAISLDPKLMQVAVYKNTKTLENVKSSKRALIQLLSEELAPVVRICGQKSGLKIDKVSRLKKRFTVACADDFWYFADAAGYMMLEIEQLVETSFKNLNDKELLTTNYLRKNNYIR